MLHKKKRAKNWLTKRKKSEMLGESCGAVGHVSRMLASSGDQCCELLRLSFASITNKARLFLTLRAAYADACNLLVPNVMANRCLNRVVLHHKTYYRLRRETPL